MNLSDSPRYPGTLPRAFDAEGIPKAPLPLIQDGVAHARGPRRAQRGALRCFLHRSRPGPGRGSGRARAHQPRARRAAGPQDEDALCRTVERGVYVTRLWYVNPVRPKETLITGVTRDGTFLIEDGRVTRPLGDLRMTDSALGLLGRVEDLASRPLLTSGGEFYGRRFATGVVCPALRAGAMRFTG